MKAIIPIAYFILGLFQLAAFMSGLEVWLDIHWLLAAIIAVPLSYIPILGTVLGVVGAHSGWGWSWLSALALFFGPMAAIFAISAANGGLQRLGQRRGSL